MNQNLVYLYKPENYFAEQLLATLLEWLILVFFIHKDFSLNLVTIPI